MWKNVRYWDGGLGEPGQITGGRRRVVWVDWEPRAQGRRQSEGAWECLVSKGLEAADGFPLRTRWELAAEGVGGCPTGVCGWKQGCLVPNSQEGRRPPTTQAAVQDDLGISPEQRSQGQGEPSFLYSSLALAKLLGNRCNTPSNNEAEHLYSLNPAQRGCRDHESALY